MLKTIILKEMRDLTGSAKFTITFGVSALLIIFSFYLGATDYKLATRQYEASKAENIRQMEGLTDWFSVEQHRVFLPPSPLASLVTGISNDIGRTTELKTRGELVAEDSRFGEDPFLAVFQFLDLGFVFQIILSLFAILLGYDAICGEKERGTLKLSFANALPRSTYIMGKLIGSFVTLSLSLVIAIALGCVILPFMGVNLSGEEWFRLLLIVLAGLLYFGAFLTLSLFVSAMTQRSSSSFLFLLVIWVGSILIIPRVSVLLAGHAVDVPSVDELAAKKASYGRELWVEFQDSMKDFKSLPVPESGEVDGLMAVFNQFMDSLTTIRDDKMDEFAGRLNEERTNRQRVQEKTAFGFARISPAASLAIATSELAGTSLDRKNRYRDRVSDYRTEYNDFMKEKTGMNIGGRMVMWKEVDDDNQQKEPTAINPNELPVFEYRDRTLVESANATALDFGLLAGFNILFFLGAFVAFTRYDVR